MSTLKTKISNFVKYLLGLSLKVKIGLGVVLLFLFSNIAAFAYSPSGFMPSTFINDVAVGGLSNDLASSALSESLQKSEVKLLLEDEESMTSKDQLGYEYASGQIADLESLQRNGFIPITWLFSSKNFTLEPNLNESKLSSYAKTVAQELSKEPTGGEVIISEEGTVEVVEPKNGFTVTAEAVANAVKNSSSNSVEISIETEAIPHTDKITNLSEIAEQAEAALSTPPTLTVDGVNVELSLEETVELLQISYEDGVASISLNNEFIQSILDDIASQVNKSASATSIELLDGVEAKRDEGEVGQRLDIEASKAAIAAALFGGNSSTIKLVLNEIASEQEYTYTYSDTSAGLTARIRDWEIQQPGVFGIGVVEMGGQSHSAYFNSNSLFTSASLYKLFVAKAVLEDVDTGKYSLSTTMSNGMTVRNALEDAIVNSGNDSAIALAEQAGGWATIDSRLTGYGFNSTTLNNYFSNGSFNGDKKTNVSDVMTLLKQLYNGTFASASSNALLLGFMADQVYVEGVNAGSDYNVANKVGFLYDLLHDAAVVTGPDGDYLIVALTDGSSWSAIAELTELVEDHLY